MNIKTDITYQYGFAMPDRSLCQTEMGLNENVVRQISSFKGEPDWMLNLRLRAYKIFIKSKLPVWGPDLTKIDFNKLYFYKKSLDNHVKSWHDLPQEIKETYDRIGVPEAERDFLAGVSAQYDSEAVYENIKKDLQVQGVLFCDLDTALKKYPEIVRQYFGKLVPIDDNIFASLNTAVWSGGSFVYVPDGVELKLPLQAYFRINAESFGQFERTLIIVGAGSKLHYIEGCTAPIYSTSSLHAAVVEIYVDKGAQVRYTTVQNWSKNIYNLVTKRAKVQSESLMEWIDCNLGSCVTMKYPSIYLCGESARGKTLSIAYASDGQIQDTGAKMIHLADRTSSQIISKSISGRGGRTSYRGEVYIAPKIRNVQSHSVCDALILDEKSRSDTYPKFKIRSNQSKVAHEASVTRFEKEKLHYLMTRGLTRSDAEGMLVNGFIKPVTNEIPFEYTIELQRLINLEMENAVG